tara:strand:+ start:1713 stop:2048 length:336 start_codon:yes stop_codon:yes gene_type:complete
MGRNKQDFTELKHVGEWHWNSDLLWKKIQKGVNPDDCWTWLGSTSIHANLFGAYRNQLHQMTQANRIIYREVYDRDCEDISIGHTCKNKYCCNPSHFKIGENNRNKKWWQE